MGNKEKKQENTPSGQQTYLYHKQEMKRQRKAPDFRPAGGARKGPARSRGTSHFWRNVRIMAAVIFFMLIFLFVAVYIAKHGGKRKGAASVKPVETVEKRTSPTTGEDDLVMEPEVVDWMGGADNENPLDTSAIRKAVFLEKRGKNLALGGDLEGAIELYREALNVWPHLTQVWADLGQAFLRQKDYARAQIALERSVEQDPSNVMVLNDLGVAYLYQGEINKAESLFLASTEINETFSDSYFNLALCHRTRKQNDEARKYFEIYLRMKPEDANTLKELAYLDAVDGKYEQSIAKLKRAILSSPEWAALFFDAAAANALLGRLEETFEYLEGALSLTSPHIVYRIYQGGAFKEMRQTEMGREFEENLADRAREQMERDEEWLDEGEAAAASLEETSVIEAISSVKQPKETTE